jgi:hypothetical protein
MEYMYADQPNPESYPVNTGSTTVAYDKISNAFIKQTDSSNNLVSSVQILNPDVDYDITHNTLNNSVVQIATNSFVTLDQNLIIPFNDFTPNLTPTSQLPITFPGNLVVVYDSIRYHIVAGYNLSNLDGVIINIKFQDIDNTYVTFSQILIEKGTQQSYTLNPAPLKMGSNIYDRYFEIKIPSLKDMNDRYQSAASSFKPETLASLTSHSGYGFIYGVPMRIEVWYVRNKVDYNGYERYESEQAAVLSLEIEDPFSNIGAVIKPSEAGDFFEYFATDNEGFIEDFIYFQNSIGNNYYITHQIETIEQIGEAFITTNTFQTIQTNGYDAPNLYRPIVKNPSSAVSFTLRYTMSLNNTVDKSSVIRIGTYSSNNPSQWGTEIQPIQLSVFPQVQKIYNRVYQRSAINVQGGSQGPTPKTITKFTNIFIDQKSVSATNVPLLIYNDTVTENSASTPAVAQPSGKLYVELTPFDNFFKFKLYKSGSDGSPVVVDLGDTSKFKMAFIDNTGKKLYVPSLSDKNIANPANGEVAFKIDDSISTKILKYNDRRFFITDGGDTAQN